MARFYFMRHGETNDNVKQLCSTQPNSDADLQNGLTQKGIKQCEQAATALAHHLENNALNIIHSGTLRTKQSAEALIKGLNGKIKIANIITDHAWRERNYGAFIGKPYSDFQSMPKEDYTPYQIESDQSFQKRIQGALQKQKPNKNKDTLIISHGGCWDILCQQVGISPIPWIQNADIFYIENIKSNKKINKIH